MAEQKIVRSTSGVVVSTAIRAGGVDGQHAEGIVVATAIHGGGFTSNHAEGVIVSSAISAGGILENHAEIVVALVGKRSWPVRRSRVRGYSSGGTSAAGASA